MLWYHGEVASYNIYICIYVLDRNMDYRFLRDVKNKILEETQNLRLHIFVLKQTMHA